MANSSVVGTLRAVLSADTAEFASAMRKASDTAEQAATDIAKTGSAFQALEPRMASVTRLVKDFSGSLERRSAEEFAMAIDKIGGAAKLSESELRRAQGVFNDFISKAKALGQEIPPHIAKLNAEIDRLHPTTTKAASGVSFLDSAWLKLTSAFSAGMIIDRVLGMVANFGREAIATAGNLVDLSAKTGLSTKALQVYGQAAKETGGSVENIADAVFKLGVNVEGGGKRMSVALEKLGLSLEQVKNLKPEDQFDVIAEKLQVMTSEQERNRIGVDLFGRSWAAVAPAVVEGLQNIADKTTIVSDEQIRALDAASDAWERFVENRKKDVTSILGSIVIIGQKLTDFSQQAERSANDISMGFANAKAGFDLGTQSMQAFEKERERIFGKKGKPQDINLPFQLPPDFIQRLQDAQDEVNKLTAADRAQIDAALKMGVTWDELPAKLRLSEDGQKAYTSASQGTTKATKETTKAIKDSADEFDKWADAATGAKLLRDLGILENKLHRLEKELTPNELALRAVAEEADKLGRVAGFLPPRLQTLVNQFGGLRAGVVSTSLVLPKLSDGFNVTGDEIRALAKDYQDFTKIINAGLPDLSKLGTKVDIGKIFQDFDASELQRAKEGMEDLARAVDAGAQMFAILSATSAGTFSTVTGGISAAIDMVQQLNAAANLASKGGMANMAASAFTIVGAFAQLGAMIQPYVGKNDIERIFEDVGQQWGTSLSRGLATGIDVTKNEVLRTLLEMSKDVSREFLLDAQSDLRRTAREFAELLNLSHIIEEQGGLDAGNLREWEERAKGLFDVIKVGGHVGAMAVDELNTLVGMFIDEAERSGVAWDDALKTLIDGARDAGIELEVITELVTRRIDDLTSAAQEFGGKAPLALQPFIQELLKANALTAEQRKLLEGLSGAPEWEQLQSIAQKYGIELSALGKTFQDARIGDIALQYARDFMTLRDAGGDVNGLLIGMQDEVQALVNDALKFGTAMPEAMRPVLEGLLQMGLLTDENGNKLEDLSRFSFTGTLEDAFKDMKSILEEIRDLLAGGLPKAARDAGQQIDNEFKNIFDRIRDRARNMSVTIPVEFDVGQFNPPSGFAVPGAAEGGYISRTGPIVAHAGEVIGPLDQLNSMFGEVRIDNRLFIDGREVTTSVVKHLREEARRQGVRPI